MHTTPDQLISKVQHETRILKCSTSQGILHISKHINPDIVLLGGEYSWTLDDLKGKFILHSKRFIIGRAGHVICLEKSLSRTIRKDNVIRCEWAENKTFAQILVLVESER